MPMTQRYILTLLLISALTAVSLPASAALASKSTDKAAVTTDLKKVYWYEGTTRKWAYQSTDEVAVVAQSAGMDADAAERIRREIDPGATIVTRKNRLLIVRSPQPVNATGLTKRAAALTARATVRSVTPVFYRSGARQPAGRMLLNGEIIVRFPSDRSDDEIKSIERTHGLTRVKTLDWDGSTFVYNTADPSGSIETANAIHATGRALYAYPNWIKYREKKMVPDDPLFARQWHLRNTGQSGGTVGEDVNLTRVWDSYRGSPEEVIAIVDDGLEIRHEDLAPNVIPGESTDLVGNDDDPSPYYASDRHGTACAGVAAARGDNTTGVSGAAPEAGLVGVRLLSDVTMTDSNEAFALGFNNDLVDIYSNSWGPEDAGLIDGPGDTTKATIAAGAASGRGGRGNLYVWAGGNGYNGREDSNTDGYANNRYTIAVAASGDDGVQADYSETGANIFVTAPSLGNNYDSGIVTTDRTGTQGYDPSNYHYHFSGTSAATPLVAGVIALMLQANPDLYWRDVHHIILQTAEKNDPTDSDWDTNGAGFHINHKYGFGRIDALAAVTSAETWPAVPAEITPTTPVTANVNTPIPDEDETGISSTINITDDVAIEYVEVCFSADHSYYGNLEITLTSPWNTESVLAIQTRKASRDYSYDNWCFGSVRHLGERSQGDWRLTVRDLQENDIGTFQSWSLKFYGTAYNGNHTITASSEDNGHLSSEGVITVPDGWNRVFIAVPDEGYEVTDLIVDGDSQGPVAQYTFGDVSRDHTITATFAAITADTLTITATAVGGGIISPSGAVTVAAGEDLAFAFAPDSYYEIDSVTVDGQNVDSASPYRFDNVTADHTIEVNFTPVVSDSSGGGGGGGGGGCFIETLFHHP